MRDEINLPNRIPSRLGNNVSTGSYRQSYIQFANCETLYHVVNEVQTNTKTPIELVLMTALAAISISCQNLIDVQLPIGNIIPTSLMLLLVSDSGERKSTVEKKLFASIREFEDAQLEVYKEQLAEWKISNNIVEQKQKGLKDAIRKLASKGLDATNEEEQLKKMNRTLVSPPKKFKLLYENATSEALFSGLSNDFPAAGLVSSEGKNIFKSTAFKDFGKQNAIWSGENIIVDRVKGESYHIRGARLTVFIMVQSDILQDYLEKEGQNARSSGLLARALMYEPQSIQGQRYIENTTTSWEHIHYFNDRIKSLLEMNVNHVGGERKVIQFSTEAAEAWVNYFNWVEFNINPRGIYRQTKDHASKLAENVGRVAALLHFFEGYDGDISLSTFNMAKNICHACSEFFVQKFDVQAQEEVDADILLNWLYNICDPVFLHGRYVAKNFVRQRCKNQLRDTDRLNKAINVLVRRGDILVVIHERTKYIDIEPNLMQKFGFNLASL
ncbi:YfjI family protein [Agitococcus lubricus]|uniref:Uncharacterized protein DUF3987 n=1 Tax=Agitococcus lubricus TaxID=1077255 RepID=A0A2T5IRR7_9GAMM|nr:YfjI family protein [Agitococcus lubricus]PTQ86535.1 uncharacterized protein DUF3987 [Agitococcus lubricus]